MVGDEALTYNKALKYFLRFPFAQGTETLATTNVSGVFTANSTSVFNDDVTINNTAAGVANPLTLYDPLSGRSALFSNSGGNLFSTLLNSASLFNWNIAGTNYLTLSNTSLTTTVPLPVPTDNSNKIATTAWYQTTPAKPATALTVVLNNTSAVQYTFPMCSGQASGTYTPINICNQMVFQPSTTTLTVAGTISTQILNASQASPGGRVLNVLNGGLFMLWNAGTSQYCQITNAADIQSAAYIALQIDPTYGVYYNMNQQGLVGGTTTAGQKPRLEIGCNQGTASEIDMCSSSATGAGGFNFYNKSNTVSLNLIGKIPSTTPATTDSSQNLATTAWVQSVLPSYAPKFTYFSPAAFDPTSITTKQCVSISGVSPSAYVQVAGIVPPSYKFRLSYNLYSTDYAIAYSFTSMFDVYPSRLTASSPVVSNNTSYGTGNLTTYNMTNAVAGLATTFNYTNATYTPYNRPYWVSCQNGGLFSGGNTTFLYLLIGWGNQISGQVPLSISLVTPGIVGAPTALNPTNGFTAGQFAMSNYTIEYLGSNVGSGIVTLL